MGRIGDLLAKLIPAWLREEPSCQHMDLVQVLAADREACEECLKAGDTWLHLRLCMVCGKVGCCDDSKNKHASAHFREVGHPLIRSLEPSESWAYCFVDEVMMPDPAEGAAPSATAP